jgi:hypothetical protein
VKSKRTQRRDLVSALARKTFVVYVSRERDMHALRVNRPGQWTVPKTARPGDAVIFYKPSQGKGWTGATERPYEAFVGAGVVHQTPRLSEPRRYIAKVGELILFPYPVDRRLVADACREWPWLRAPQAPSGARVPSGLEDTLIALLGRLAFSLD